MIEIKDKSLCCGCSACAQICPKSSIKMVEDEEGSLYPVVDQHTCIECGACEKVCIELGRFEKKRPMLAYASKNKNEKVRMSSSSGGIFTPLAEYVIAKGGVVFGVKLNDKLECIHDYTENIEGLSAFRGSKYLPSDCNNSYKKVDVFLKQGKLVLYSGTPCQVAGLNKYLKKDYDNLITVDLTCHGVPSPIVWRSYMKWVKNKMGADKDSLNVKFRDKSQWLWEDYHITIKQVDGTGNSCYSCSHKSDPFMQLFIRNVILRPSCYRCPAKAGSSNADITLSDFWHMSHFIPDFNDHKGVTLVFLNTEKGISLFNNVDADSIETPVLFGTKHKPAWYAEERAIPPTRDFMIRGMRMFPFYWLSRICLSEKIQKITNYLK